MDTLSKFLSSIMSIFSVGDDTSSETDKFKGVLADMMDIAEMYGEVSGDERVTGGIIATKLILSAAEKLKDDQVPADQKLGVVYQVIDAIKGIQ